MPIDKNALLLEGARQRYTALAREMQELIVAFPALGGAESAKLVQISSAGAGARPKGTMSEEGKQKIREAQHKRWEKKRKDAKRAAKAAQKAPDAPAVDPEPEKSVVELPL